MPNCARGQNKIDTPNTDPDGSTEADPIGVSVIVPTLNGASTLPRQLNALAQQRLEASWEVVIADNGSSDGTRGLVDDYGLALPSIRWVDASERRGRHFAANMGADAARGRLLVFLDDDDEVSDDFLSALHKELQTSDIVCALLDHEKLNPEWVMTVAEVQSDGLSQGFGFLPFAGGGTLGVRREVFDSIGGFNESMHYCEDVDLCWRAQLAGYRLQMTREAVIYVSSRTTVREMFRQHKRFGRARPLLYRKYQRFGMPRRPLTTVVGDWVAIVKAIPFLGSKPVRARWARRLGRALGFIQGSVRHRVLYF